MIWPFRSVETRLLEREQQLLQARIKDLEAQLGREVALTAYFRDRYERIADMTLFRAGETQTPIHVEPAKSKREAVGMSVMRAAAAVGHNVGAFKSPNGTAADLPGR